MKPEDRITEITNRFAALVIDIRMAHAMDANMRIVELKQYLTLQLRNLVADARLNEAARIAKRIDDIPAQQELALDDIPANKKERTI